MKASSKVLAFVLLGAALTSVATHGPTRAIALPAPTVLESYDLTVGNDSEGVTSSLMDRRLGGGSAKIYIRWRAKSVGTGIDQSNGRLKVEVSRSVRPGHTIAPLNCQGIDLRGYDANDVEVFANGLPAFRFERGGHVKAGFDLPDTVARITVSVRGQYE